MFPDERSHGELTLTLPTAVNARHDGPSHQDMALHKMATAARLFGDDWPLAIRRRVVQQP